MVKPEKLKTYLFNPVSASNLGLFRFLFGWVMFWEFGRNWWIDGYGAFKFIDPPLHFKFPYFGWITELPEPAMNVIFYAGTVASVMLALGFLYRASAAFLFVSYTYLFLLDVSYYNNHYYFFSLILFLMIFADANRAFAVDRYLFKLPNKLPRWQLMLFRFQVVIVYFFGGISKILNADWLRNISGSYLLRNVLLEKQVQLPEKLVQYMSIFYSYGGMLFDLSIGAVLLTRRFFYLGVLAVVVFNLTNFYTLTIGSFPMAMIGALSLFWPTRHLDVLANWLDALVYKVTSLVSTETTRAETTPVAKRNQVFYLLAVWMAVHLIIPFKHLLIPSNVYWTEEGKLCTWNMMAGGKNVQVGQVYALIVNPSTGDVLQQIDIDVDRFLNYKQKRMLGKRPYVIPQFTRFLEQGSLETEGLRPEEIEIYAEILVSRNGRPFKYIVDPNIDLSEVEFRPMQRNEWILTYANEGL